MIPYANEKGIFVISPTVSDDSYNAHDDLFFRVNASSSEYGTYLAQRAVQGFGVKRPMLVGDERNARYKDIIFDSFKRELVSLGGNVAKSVSFYSNLPLPTDEIIDGITESSADAVVLVTASISDMEYSGDSARSFLNDYRAAYGVAPSFTAVFGWETASILRRVFASAANADPVTLKKELLNIGTFDGVEEPIVFDRSGDASRTLFLYTIDHGRFKRLE
ncbi:MAG TPA: ABC transporter substrate-binding protein [Spirochaetia bacterium]|nr:ABC transporter substrate-binding protein [Spirochaetia bacterium]